MLRNKRRVKALSGLQNSTHGMLSSLSSVVAETIKSSFNSLSQNILAEAGLDLSGFRDALLLDVANIFRSISNNRFERFDKLVQRKFLVIIKCYS